MQLENLMGYQPKASQETQQTYFAVGDLEGMSASALYTNERITGLNSSGFQLHFHENRPNEIASPKLKVGNETVLRLSNYQAAMGDHYARQLGLPQIRKGS